MMTDYEKYVKYCDDFVRKMQDIVDIVLQELPKEEVKIKNSTKCDDTPSNSTDKPSRKLFEINKKILEIEAERRNEVKAEREKISDLKNKIEEHEHNITCINKEADSQIEEILVASKRAKSSNDITSSKNDAKQSESKSSELQDLLKLFNI